jgi:hypothetical protein
MKMIYANNKDKKLCSEALTYNALLYYGFNDLESMQKTLDLFDEKVLSIRTLDYDKGLGFSNDNVSIMMNDDNKLRLFIKGLKNAPSRKEKTIKRIFVTEYSRLFSKLNMSEHIDLKDLDNYGEMAYDTTMLLLGAAAEVCFDKSFRGDRKSVNQLFDESYINNRETHNSLNLLTDVTRLEIAAFQNDGNFSYYNNFKKDNGLANSTYTTSSGKVLKTNDFLYGMMNDPRHIEKEYDKLMGEGTYLNLVKRQDELYNKYKNKKAFNEDDLLKIRTIATDLNLYSLVKNEDARDNNILNEVETMRNEEHFARINKALQNEVQKYSKNKVKVKKN